MRILCVYAHPDDESFGPAAALAKYARAGAVIHGLFFTRGEQGQACQNPAPRPNELGRLRESDLREAATTIGFAGLDLLEYPDGRLAETPAAELEAIVSRAIRVHSPDVLITFGPGGITRHPDHIAVSRATTSAFHRAREQGEIPRELYYDALAAELAAERGLEDVPDGHPNAWIEVAETASVKLEALRIHARHVLDAGEMVQRLEREPLTVTTLHRAWPPVQQGRRVSAFLEESSGFAGSARPERLT